jgi:hypothetical protein
MTYKSLKRLKDQAAKVDLVVQWLPLLPLVVAVIYPFEPLFPPSYYPSGTIFCNSLALLPSLTLFHLLVPIPLLFTSFQSRVSRHVGHYPVVKSMDRLWYNLDRLPRVSLVSVLLMESTYTLCHKSLFRVTGNKSDIWTKPAPLSFAPTSGNKWEGLLSLCPILRSK